MNAVIYARSSFDSRWEESVEDRLCVCGEYTWRNGMTVVGSYIDRSHYSAELSAKIHRGQKEKCPQGRK